MSCSSCNQKPIRENFAAAPGQVACAQYQGPCTAAMPRAPQPCCHPTSHECACQEYGLGYHTLATAYGS
jgi:hypothetical protein